MPKVTGPGEYINPVSIGPRLEYVPVLTPPIPSVPASGNWLSALVQADGFYNIMIGVTSTQAGALNVQRYIDEAGLVPIGAAETVALVANTAKALHVNDTIPFGSYTVQITNTGGSPATITGFAIRTASN